MKISNLPKPPPSFNFKVFMGVLSLFIIICVLNIPILVTLWRHSFDDGTYSHAYLIPFITLYLYYLLSGTGQLAYRKDFSLSTFLVFVISCYLLFITSTAQISIGYWFSLLLVFVTSITVLFRFNWYIVFPAAFLIFIFPFWGGLTPILQNLSVIAVTYMMSFTSVPIFVEGKFITIPAGLFEIAGGCSGLRYIIVSLAISSLFVFLYIKNFKRAVLFLSIAILGGLLTNWIRITALILIGEYTNMESSLMEDHNTFGWYLYIPFMLLLFSLGNRISDTDHIKKAPSTGELPKISIMIMLFVTILVSSSGINRSINPILYKVNKFTPFLNEYSPRIHYVSSIENLPSVNKIKKVYKTYNFDGNDLDGKPTYYAQKLIPNTWKDIATKESPPWKIHYLSKGSKKAVLLYTYEIDGFVSSNPNDFKMARLSKATKNIKATKLHLIFSYCTKDCIEVEESILSTVKL